jgi:uncharacterized protein with PhoU and TrkA domain
MSSEEEIKYRPISIRDIITELHTTTTLMVDLAYSAVLFNDNELAQEVIEFEERVDYLKTLLLMNTALVVRDAEDAEAMVGIMRMGAVADRISDAAGDIARLVQLGLNMDPYVLEAFSKTKERIVRTQILSGSVITGKQLSKIESKIGVNIMAIRRGRELIIRPDPETDLRDSDVLLARGSDVALERFDKLARGELKKIPHTRFNARRIIYER